MLVDILNRYLKWIKKGRFFMNFEEKKDVVSDDKKNIGGLPFIIFVLLVCMAGSVFLIVIKHSNLSIRLTIPSDFTALWLQVTDIIMRVIGVYFVIVSVQSGYRKVLFNENNIKWYQVIISMTVGSIFIIFGISVIMLFTKLMIDFYY